MLATVFGWYGAFGTTMLLSAYIFVRHGMMCSMMRYGWYAVFGIITLILATGYGFNVYALPWLIHHTGTRAAYGTEISLGILAVLFLRHVLVYSFKRLKR